jgi:hypothetical protein
MKLSIKALNEKKATESSKLTRLAEKVQAARKFLSDARDNYDAIERSLEAEQATALFNEQPWPTRDAEKQLSTAKSAANTAATTLAAAVGALELQTAVVEEIDAELNERAMEAFGGEVKPAIAEMRKAQQAFIAAAIQVRYVARKHNAIGYPLFMALFPGEGMGPNCFDGSQRRDVQLNLFHSALNHSDYMEINKNPAA